MITTNDVEYIAKTIGADVYVCGKAVYDFALCKKQDISNADKLLYVGSDGNITYIDTDKLKECSLSCTDIDGVKVIEQSRLVFLCKKAYADLATGEDLKTLEVYIKLEEGVAYFVANGVASEDYKVEL